MNLVARIWNARNGQPPIRVLAFRCAVCGAVLLPMGALLRVVGLGRAGSAVALLGSACFLLWVGAVITNLVFLPIRSTGGQGDDRSNPKKDDCRPSPPGAKGASPQPESQKEQDGSVRER